jgi:hypothetical protein
MSLGTKIFVIHGRDKRARSELFTFLRAIGLSPIEWTKALTEAGGGAPLISDILDKAIRADRAFIVLLTPDDIARLKPEHANHDDDPDLRPAGQARPNVLFEAGMAFGRYPDHTVLVEFGRVRGFTDVAGRFRVRLDNSAESRSKLASRLKAIGCEVDLDGTDWYSAGDLTPPETKPVPVLQPVVAVSNQKSSSSGLSVMRPEFTTSSGTWDVVMENFSIVPRKRSGFVVHGEITNKEPNALTLILKATFFGTDGTIRGSADGVVNDLGNTERRAFELTAYDTIPGVARVHVHVDNAMAL